MKKQFALALLAAAGCISAAVAADIEGPKVAFDATYVQTGPQGQNQMRMASDGKGHMRTETSAQGMKMVTIMDYPNKMAYSIMEAQKMVMKVPLRSNGAEVHDEVTAKKAGAKALGAKVIDGHPCHGWEYTSEGGTVQTWVGDDIHYLVKSETTTKGGMKVGMELKSWTGKEPSADAFKVPTGYKVAEIPGMAH